MKNFLRTIAMLLVLVMLASSFTSCLTYTRGLSLLTIVDIIFLPISLIALLIYVIINDASSEMETQMYLTGAEGGIHTDFYYLMDKVYSLSDEELTALRQIVSSIPEAERISSIQKLNSLTETKRASLVNAYNSLSKTEFASSIEKMNSLSEAQLVSLLQNFISLSEAELDSLLKQLKTTNEPEYITSVYPHGKINMELNFQY
ncbi:MAG: hypothetical protein LBQ82_02430 [Treponema sp.]|jgi:hypothetical protein|nr:hypothetical protein [Treponema sp.]